MEKISELRNICQKPKVLEREEIGMSYSGLKTQFDLKLSIYFTWIFLRLGLSANAVTILSGISSIIGGFLLASKSIWIVILGILFLHLYYLLDYSDGEVARYNNKDSISGWFLDWYMLFVRDAAMFTGLSIGAFASEPSKLLIICGFLSVLTPIMDKTIIGCGWTVISWSRLKMLQKGIENFRDSEEVNLDRKNQQSQTQVPKNNKKTLISFLIKKLWRISISIFQHHWSPLMLLLLALSQIIINNYYLLSFDFRHYLIIYAGIYGPIYVFIKLYMAVKRKTFEDRFERLFHDNNNNVSASEYIF